MKNHAPPDHWFSKLRADWLQPKQGGVKKKKKKKKIVSAATTESQSPPPQSPSIPPPAHGISSLQPPSTVDTPSALSPTATQYSQDDTQDLIAYETDDGTTLPPSSPPDLDAMSKMVAAFETYTVEDSVTQQLQDTMTEGLLQDQERGPTIPIIITDVDAREPNAAQTSASSTSLATFLSNGQLDDAAPATHSAVVKPIVSVPELESTPRPFLETHQTFGSAPNVPGPFTHANLLGLLLDQSVAQTRYFSAPHPVNAGYMNLLPSDNSLYNSVSNATSESALLLASTNSSALPSASATETPDKAKTRKTNPSQRKKTKPTVLKEGQRNLKNNGIHQCPVAGCTETSTRYYDLINRHVRRAHPEEALIRGIHKPAKARTQPEGAGKLDLNRNMMSVDVEEIKPSQDFNCPSCFHPYSRRDALIRHAESQINPERKNKPSCNLTVEQVRSLRKKFKVK